MSVDTIFEDMAGRLVSAIMLHSELYSYFSFLSLKGLAEVHKAQYFDESEGYLKLERYYADHYAKMLADTIPRNPHIVPSTMKSMSFYEVVNNERNAKFYISSGMKKWIAWEYETKSLYSMWYKRLIELNEVAAAEFIAEYIRDVDDELARAEALDKEMKAMDYDLPTIYSGQEVLEKSERKRLKRE